MSGLCDFPIMNSVANRKILTAALIGLALLQLPAAAWAELSMEEKTIVEQCDACHSTDQEAKVFGIPYLAGQYPQYIIKQIDDYNTNRRRGHEQAPFPKGISDESWDNISQRLSRVLYLPRIPELNTELLTLMRKGERLYTSGDETTGAKQCVQCHGEKGMGRSKNISLFPVLKHQDKTYLISQLQKYRKDERTNDQVSMMRGIAKTLSDDDILAVATYLAFLPERMPEPMEIAAPQKAPAAKSPRPEPPKKTPEPKPVVEKPVQTPKVVAQATPEAKPTAKPAAPVVTEVPKPTPKPQEPVAKAEAPKTEPAKPTEPPKAEARPLKIESAPAISISTLPAEPLVETAVEVVAPKATTAESEPPASARQTPASKAEQISRGKNIAVVCEACHGTQGRSTNPSTPRLAGQHAGYIAKQLKDFKAGRRSDAVMSSMAASLSDQDIRDVAEYFAAQKRF